jgi:hypothetical protein
MRRFRLCAKCWTVPVSPVGFSCGRCAELCCEHYLGFNDMGAVICMSCCEREPKLIIGTGVRARGG